MFYHTSFAKEFTIPSFRLVALCRISQFLITVFSGLKAVLSKLMAILFLSKLSSSYLVNFLSTWKNAKASGVKLTHQTGV